MFSKKFRTHLVESPGEKRGESGNERHCPVPASRPHSRPHQTLLGNKTLDVPGGVVFPQILGKGGIFHVSVQSNDSRIALGDFNKRRTVGGSCGHQFTHLVRGGTGQFYVGDVDRRGVVFERFQGVQIRWSRVFQETLNNLHRLNRITISIG